MRKASFLMVFLFCFYALATVQAGPVSLYESADDVDLGESSVTPKSENTTTFQPKDSKVIKKIESETKATDDKSKKDAGTEKTISKSSSGSGVLSGKAYVNSTGWLNLREKPSKSSKRLAKLYYNDVVNIVGHQNGWYQIDSPKNGWVMAQFVSSTPNNNVNADDTATITSGKGYVNCDGWLNLRAKPTKKSSVLAKLHKNDEVNIIANNGAWYQIDSPQSGWVMAEFISSTKTTSSSSSSSSSDSGSSSGSVSEPPTEGTQVTGPITTEPMGGAESSLYNPGTKGNGTVTINTLGESWVVVKAPIGVLEYSKFLKNNKVCQNKDTSKYGSACLSFAYTHAWGLYCGNRGVSAEKRSGGGNFKTLIDDNKQYILNAIYLEIKAGRPCILHVNGNKQGTGRHFVTCVGFKSSVTSGETITEDDLLILDSWDAQIERMDQKNSRFMTTGKQCRKSYSGHRIQYMK